MIKAQKRIPTREELGELAHRTHGDANYTNVSVQPGQFVVVLPRVYDPDEAKSMARYFGQLLDREGFDVTHTAKIQRGVPANWQAIITVKVKTRPQSRFRTQGGGFTRSAKAQRWVLRSAKARGVKSQLSDLEKTATLMNRRMETMIQNAQQFDRRTRLNTVQGDAVFKQRDLDWLFKQAVALQNQVQNVPKHVSQPALPKNAARVVDNLRWCKFYLSKYTAQHLLGALAGAQGSTKELVRVLNFIDESPWRGGVN